VKLVGWLHVPKTVLQSCFETPPFIQSDDDDARIKITDFGFARRVHTPQSLTSRCGTPTYVAPEILKNIPHDQSADLWSVGVIVYLLLVGYPPFMKDTQAELFQQIRSCDWKFPKNDWQNISKDAKDLIEHLLVADPLQRWTADEALNCAWILDDRTSSTPVDLMTAIESLRERRARLRQFANPVVWQKDEDSSPVDASLKMHDAICDEGSNSSITAAAGS
jgi:serine/threonine protein kinase